MLADVKVLVNDLMRMNKRQQLHQLFNCLLVVCSALMIWKGLMVVTGSESPIVVVLRSVWRSSRITARSLSIFINFFSSSSHLLCCRSHAV